jgi:hypothetical protein
LDVEASVGGDGDDPLREHRALLVRDPLGLPWIGDGRIQGIEESDPPGGLAKQQDTGIGGEAPPLEVGDDLLALDSGKGQGFGLQSVMRQPFLLRNGLLC